MNHEKTKGQIRAERKAARAAGQPWNVEMAEAGGLEIVRSRTQAQERRHAGAMNRQAQREYDFA